MVNRAEEESVLTLKKMNFEFYDEFCSSIQSYILMSKAHRMIHAV